MTREEVIEQAKTIMGRYSFGLPNVTERALNELGGEGVLAIFQRYATGDWPGASSDAMDEVTLPGGKVWQGPLNEARYQVGDQEYVALTEAHAHRYTSRSRR